MYAILGATGRVGRAAALELRHRGLPVRAIVRDAMKAEYLEQNGCEVAVADVHDADGFPGSHPGLLLSLPAYASKQIGRLHSPAVVLKVRARPLPMKIPDGLKYRHVQSQSRKSAEQQGLAP